MTNYMWLDTATAIDAGTILHRGKHLKMGGCLDVDPICEPYIGQDQEPPPPVSNPKAYAPPPKHYSGAGGIDPWAVWDAFDLDRYTANAVKYLLRAGKKEINGEQVPVMDDLIKARNYINKAIEREGERLRGLSSS